MRCGLSCCTFKTRHAYIKKRKVSDSEKIQQRKKRLICQKSWSTGLSQFARNFQNDLASVTSPQVNFDIQLETLYLRKTRMFILMRVDHSSFVVIRCSVETFNMIEIWDTLNGEHVIAGSLLTRNIISGTYRCEGRSADDDAYHYFRGEGHLLYECM